MANGGVQPRAICPINCHSGLHQIQESVSQFTYMGQHSTSIFENLNSILEITYERAPLREHSNGQTYQLDRQGNDNIDIGNRERRLEAALWQYGYRNPIKLADTVDAYTLSYQMPLRGSHGDAQWGMVDVIGACRNGLPIVFELKQDNAADSPLRVVIEGAAYAVAVRKAWNTPACNLRSEWQASLQSRGILDTADTLPKCLQEVPIVAVASHSYWERKIARNEPRQNGQVRSGAWKPFKDLCQKLGKRGFPVYFLSIKHADLANPGQVEITDITQLAWSTDFPGLEFMTDLEP